MSEKEKESLFDLVNLDKPQPGGDTPAIGMEAIDYDSAKADDYQSIGMEHCSLGDPPTKEQIDKWAKESADDNLSESKEETSAEIWTQGGTVVPLWPYGDHQNFEDLDFAKIEAASNSGSWDEPKTESEKLVNKFLLLWLAAIFLFGCFYAFKGSGSGGNFFYFWHFALGGIFVFAMKLCRSTRGCSFMVIRDIGIDFYWTLDGSVERREQRTWSFHGNCPVELVSTGPLKKKKIRFHFSFNDKPVDIPIEAFPNRNRWKNVANSLLTHNPDVDIDENIIESIMPDAKDTTYTELWLEALGSPPKRERLLPLDENVSLNGGKYKVERRLGAGGQGTAYLATIENRNKENNSQVVLKEYMLPVYVDMKARKQAIERFEAEAKMLEKLKSESIVELKDFFVEDHRAYLVLEYIQGESLKDKVDNNGPLTNSEVVQFGKSMCDILIYLQSQEPPIVHRDFTPDNLMQSGAGTVKLIDFMVAHEGENVGLTSQVVGKQAYMPPEQFKGKVSIRSDIYAAGATLYFLLTGKEPEALMPSQPILEREGTCPGLNEIIARATAQDKQERFANAKELKQALEAI